MLKKFSIIILIMLALFIIGCAKPAEQPSGQVATPAAESPADELGTEITGINTADEELDFELEDIDDTLSDIENI